MIISDKISAQKIVKLCEKQGIKDIVISPGSRNAPFIISFTNNPYFNCYSIVDERSAGYFALGIAQQKNKPVVLICTSGTATLNYAPAIAEAHYQGIPLLILTADRQQNGLSIGDGQSINQKGIYRNFCENNYSIIEDENDSSKENFALIQEAFYELTYKNKAVHINIQLTEPLYNTIDISPIEKCVSYGEDENFDIKIEDKWIGEWDDFSSKLILISQNNENSQELSNLILDLTKKDKNIVVLTETTSNCFSKNFNSCIDRTISLINENNVKVFVPELTVTIGNSVISKKIKQLFRVNKPIEHWSVSNPRKEDVFITNHKNIEGKAVDFFSSLIQKIKDNSKTNFKESWNKIQNTSTKNHQSFIENVPFSDLKAFDIILDNLPTCNLQMGNSSVVRYIQLFNQRKDIQYNSNRGVSGIEGCTSTAIGASLVTKNSILISGDISFFYDSNAFWNNHVPAYFKTIVINNGEGNIFKILPQPKENEKALPFFITPNSLSIEKFCDLYNLNYLVANNKENLEETIKELINTNNKPTVLEVNTVGIENDEILKEYFQYLSHFE